MARHGWRCRGSRSRPFSGSARTHEPGSSIRSADGCWSGNGVVELRHSVDPRTRIGICGDPAWVTDQVPGQGNLVTDIQLAALAIEHGLAIYSADTDFARFTELTWLNPISP